jgi:hypothetical protein
MEQQPMMTQLGEWFETLCFAFAVDLERLVQIDLHVRMDLRLCVVYHL